MEYKIHSMECICICIPDVNKWYDAEQDCITEDTIFSPLTPAPSVVFAKLLYYMYVYLPFLSLSLLVFLLFLRMEARIQRESKKFFVLFF